MKCPHCGKWNSVSLPHCFYCGMPLPDEPGASLSDAPAWRAELQEDKGKAYIRVDEAGEADDATDPREQLAREMADLKTRKLQGEKRQRELRYNAASRGIAPSARTVRTTSNRSTFFSINDNPESTLRPVDPALIEEGEVRADARLIHAQKYRPVGQSQLVRVHGGSAEGQPQEGYAGAPGEPSVYDGYADISSYMPLDDRAADYGHSSRRTPVARPRHRFGLRRFLRALIVLGSLCALIWIGWKVVLPILSASRKDEKPKATVTSTIRNDLAAHTVTIPGEDGQRITIRELRTSAIVSGGVAIFDIPDHIWYDEYEAVLQETMTVTLTPYLLTASGKQAPMEPIRYDIDVPLSPIELSLPDNPYKVVSTAMYTITLFVREGSTLHINGQNYSDLVGTENGKVSYNATVQPIGENVFEFVVRSQYCRENRLTVTLYREKQDIPLDLSTDTSTRSTDSVMTIRATTLPGAVVKVLSPYTDLNITETDTTGSFSFKAIFDAIGDNTIVITADYPGKKTTRLEYVVNYVPSIDVYSRKAWDIVTQYTDLMGNIDLRKKQSQIYVCKGTITSIETTKPQRAFMNCGTDESPVIIYVENASRTTWEEGKQYRLYGDAYGMYSSRPWLIVRYTYGLDEVARAPASPLWRRLAGRN